MTDPSTTTPVVAEREDNRTVGPMTGGERAVLDHWLDLYDRGRPRVQGGI